jgi:hypothetical protein
LCAKHGTHQHGIVAELLRGEFKEEAGECKEHLRCCACVRVAFVLGELLRGELKSDPPREAGECIEHERVDTWVWVAL